MAPPILMILVKLTNVIKIGGAMRAFSFSRSWMRVKKKKINLKEKLSIFVQGKVSFSR